MTEEQYQMLNPAAQVRAKTVDALKNELDVTKDSPLILMKRLIDHQIEIQADIAELKVRQNRREKPSLELTKQVEANIKAIRFSSLKLTKTVGNLNYLLMIMAGSGAIGGMVSGGVIYYLLTR